MDIGQLRVGKGYLMVTVGQQGKLKENLTELHIIVRTTGCLHTLAALQLQLFVSDLPLNQSEYTADTLSSNQNRVDHRKWNFSVIFTLAHL